MLVLCPSRGCPCLRGRAWEDRHHSNLVYCYSFWWCFASDMDNRHSVLRAARLRVKCRPGQAKIVMLKQLKEIAKDVKKYGLGKAIGKHPHIGSMLRNVKAVGGTIRGSPFERGKYVHTLRGLQTVLGLPSIWLTSEFDAWPIDDPLLLLLALLPQCVVANSAYWLQRVPMPPGSVVKQSTCTI